MKLGIIYAGQGSQYVGMGRSLYDHNKECQEILDQVQLDFDLKQLMFEGNEEQLSQTAYTQPAMVAVATMVTRMLDVSGIRPDYVCGLSLGEYSALQASGVFEPVQAIELVRQRGLAMEEAAKGMECLMIAIIGLDRDLLEAACKEASSKGYVAIANYNCPGQLVIAGEKEAVEKAGELALEKGARRAIPLKTSGPFHTALLKKASERLHEVFQETTFQEMHVPVIFNSTGKELEPGVKISEMLEKQVMSPVYFEDSIRYMIAQRVDTIIEVGPGKVLSGFVKKIDRSIALYAIEDQESLEKVVQALGGQA